MGLIEMLTAGVDQRGAMPTGVAHVEYARLANLLARAGVVCVAEVTSIEATGRTDPAGAQYAIGVRVEGNGEPYDATVGQFLVEEAADSYGPGARWEAKADPEDRTRLLLYGPAS